MSLTVSILHLLLALILAPLLMAVINRTKARFAGRKGQPLLQPYHDLFKLMRKGAVYSRTTSWVFRAGPVVSLSAVLICLTVVPAGRIGAVISFRGDFLFLAYALGLMRFITVLAAMDTGSAFEGMGASREVQFALLAELVFLAGLTVLGVGSGQLSLSGMTACLWSASPAQVNAPALLVAMSLMLVLLAENARIPVDDPTTHLELTMIHEVMVLDHGGVDLAFIEYAAALKLWLFAALLTSLVIPVATGRALVDLAVAICGIFLTAIGIGVIESTMARLRLRHVPRMLLVAMALSLAALLWVSR
jgi:formate hydrogenlyase subunit 4